MDLTWKGGAEVFLLFANIYFKLIVLAKLLKSFSKELLELGTGGVGINFKPLEKEFNLVIRESFIGEIFNIFLVLNSSFIG